MASDLAARKYARAVLLDAKLPKDAKSFAKLLEGQISSFVKKKRRIANGFGKLLDMLL